MARKYKYLANMAACIALRACQYGNIFQVRTFLIERIFCRAMDVQIQIDSQPYIWLEVQLQPDIWLETHIANHG